MQFILSVFAFITVFYMLYRKYSGIFGDLSQNARVGIFTFALGVILSFFAFSMGVSGNIYSYPEAPSFLFSFLILLSNMAFMGTVACLVVGIYRLVASR
ncbi:hypothetical protein [Virgibacillus sediminis]|uniref:3-isopropylmalate dehydrogenase n=1 Tax=Virgibacillus sediminis TaxID=202260 RepID=A0ABV7A3M3_9BACI